MLKYIVTPLVREHFFMMLLLQVVLVVTDFLGILAEMHEQPDKEIMDQKALLWEPAKLELNPVLKLLSGIVQVLQLTILHPLGVPLSLYNP